MRERAEAMKAKLVVEVVEGQGTRIIVAVPHLSAVAQYA
jgi:signal transduction histidine kinase